MRRSAAEGICHSRTSCTQRMKNERSDWQLKYTNALVSLACLLLCFSSSSDLIGPVSD